MALNKKAQAKLDEFGYKTLEEYYKSPLWNNFRAKVVEFYKRTNKWNCAACKCGGNRFDLHHIDYNNFGCFNRAEVFDIYILCKSCHEQLHYLWDNSSLTLREATQYVLDGKLLEEKKPTSVIRRI